MLHAVFFFLVECIKLLFLFFFLIFTSLNDKNFNGPAEGFEEAKRVVRCYYYYISV